MENLLNNDEFSKDASSKKVNPKVTDSNKIEYKAQWKANTYTIIYNSNDGQGTMSSQTANYDQNINLKENKFAKAGYDFMGWRIGDNNSSNIKQPGESVKNLTNQDKAKVNVYADWMEITVTKIEVTAPTKITYIEGEELELTGGKIKVTYNNNKTENVELTNSGVKITGYDKTKTGQRTITVSYGGKTGTFKVTVKGFEVTINNNLKHSEIDGTTYIITEKGTKVEELLKDIELNTQDYNLIIKDSSSKNLADKDTLKTNQTIAIDGAEKDFKKVVIVRGDLISDGKVDIMDIVKLNNYRNNKKKSEKNWSESEKIAFK